MLQFNKFYTGEIVRNHETGEHGKVVGFRDTIDVPQYEIIVLTANTQGLGLDLTVWPETVLQPSIFPLYDGDH